MCKFVEGGGVSNSVDEQYYSAIYFRLSHLYVAVLGILGEVTQTFVTSQAYYLLCQRTAMHHNAINLPNLKQFTNSPPYLPIAIWCVCGGGGVACLSGLPLPGSDLPVYK
jgi:hypothetical protein